VLSAGADALSPQFDALSETGLKMGKLIGFTAAESVETLADTIGGFTLKMTEAGKVADVFFRTQQLAQLSVRQLAESMRDGAPAAGAFGQTIETTSTLFAAMARSGFKGFDAGTALKIMFTRLGSDIPEVTSQLKAMNVSVNLMIKDNGR